MASANGQHVNIGDKIIRNPNAAYRISVDNFVEQTNRVVDGLVQQINENPDSPFIPRWQEGLKKAKSDAEFTRHNVIYKGEEVKSVMIHEMGHVLAGQKAGFITGLGATGAVGVNKEIEACYKQSLQNGDIKQISAYARIDADEFFAECFTIYTMGKEKLPVNIENMIKGVLAQWKK